MAVRTIALVLLCALPLVEVCSAAAPPKSFLLFPVTGGGDGQEWVASSVGALLEQGLASLAGVRVVGGSAREEALRALVRQEQIDAAGFSAICRRAGADFGLLGGVAVAEGRLTLDLRLVDVAAEREFPSYRGEEGLARAFALVAVGVQHLASAAGVEISSGEKARLERAPAASLEAYAAVRAALLESQPERRIAQLRRALELDPAYLDAVLRLGVELFRQGAAAEALPLMERAAALGPEVAEAHNNYGVVLAAAGKPELAQREFERAIDLASAYEEARLNLARVLEDRGLAGEAEKQYQAVLEENAANDKARHGLAVLYDGQGKPELALREFRLLSGRRPDLAEREFISAGQEARKARDYPAAEKYFLRAIEINPQIPDAYAELGTSSYLAGEFQKGAEFFRKALSLAPQRADVHHYLGLALEKSRRPAEALGEFRRAIELGGPPEARLGLARVLLESGDAGPAVEELNRLLTLHPDHAEAKLLLAQAAAEAESRRRLLEGQSRFANQRLERLEQIISDLTRTNRDLEGRLLGATQDKQLLEKEIQRDQAQRGRRDEELLAATQELESRRKEAEWLLAERDRLQSDLAAAQASVRVGESSGGTAELQQRLAGLLVEQAREREDRRQEAKAALERLAVLQAGKEQTEQALAKEREERREEASRLAAELAAAGQKGQALAAERDRIRQETERLQADLATEESWRKERDQKVGEAAELRGRLAAGQAAAERLEQDLARERQERREEAERLGAQLSAAEARARLAAERLSALEAERARDARAAQERIAALGGEVEQSRSALAAAKAQIEELRSRLAATEVEGYRRIEEQRGQMTRELAAREGELAAFRARERGLTEQLERLRGDLAALQSRAAGLESRAAEDARTAEKARQVMRDDALELGRISLRSQSWERARGYFERVIEADAGNGEAYYSLGEVYFHLGHYERSKAMYQKAKEIF